MKKTLISIVLAILMLIPVLPASAQKTFTDVPEGSWYHDAVYYCYENKLFAGMTDTTFAPNDGMTRAMFVTVLASQHDLNKDDFKSSSFTDVAAGKWYTANIEWAYKEGLVAGVGNGRFAPDKVITRAQLVTLIFKYAEYLGYDVTVGEGLDISSYKDAKDVPAWALDGFKWAIAGGVVTGVKSGGNLLLSPNGKATRAAVALIMMKLADLAPRFQYKSVIILGVDGAGAFNTETPNMDRIFANGAYTNKMLTGVPTISAQCWGTLLSGVKPSEHGFTNGNITSGGINGNPEHPTIFKMVRDSMPDAKLAAFCNWYPIYEGIIENNIGVDTGKGEDREIADKIIDYLDEQQPTLLFAQFDGVDHVGHGSGYNTDSYYKEIQTVDGYIGEIYDKIVEMGYEKDTLFIVTADHGGIGVSHGGLTEEEKFVFFGAHGASINNNSQLSLISRDVASVVTFALGVKGAANMDSYLPSLLFTDRMHNPSRPQGGTGIVTGGITPQKGSTGYIGNFLDEEKIRTWMPFDGDMKPVIGIEAGEKNGKIYFVEGINGKAMLVQSSDGSAYMPTLSFGSGSFSIATWVRLETMEGDMPIYGNMDWVDEYSKGFVLCSGDVIKFNVGNGGNICNEFFCYYPNGFDGEWMHTVLVVDKEAAKVRLYIDFELAKEIDLDETFINETFDGREQNDFYFANDGTGDYADGTLTAEYDDFLVYDGVMTDVEIAKLKSYYFDRK